MIRIGVIMNEYLLTVYRYTKSHTFVMTISKEYKKVTKRNTKESILAYPKTPISKIH